MKCGRTDVHCKTHSLPQLRFEEQLPTDLVLGAHTFIQELFSRLGLKERPIAKLPFDLFNRSSCSHCLSFIAAMTASFACLNSASRALSVTPSNAVATAVSKNPRLPSICSIAISV